MPSSCNVLAHIADEIFCYRTVPVATGCYEGSPSVQQHRSSQAYFQGLFLLSVLHQTPHRNLNESKRRQSLNTNSKWLQIQISFFSIIIKSTKMMQTGKFLTTLPPVYIAHECNRCHFLTVLIEFHLFHSRKPSLDPILAHQSSNPKMIPQPPNLEFERFESISSSSNDAPPFQYIPSPTIYQDLRFQTS